ncbi:MAG: GNAT family N-acetyltransferase [Bacteriovoracaceae bacterium]|nr:GNAT family N-acetyltransferase [Bacteriovoracaceae bacterium]
MSNVILRHASLDDAVKIVTLYNKVYQGSYPDQTLTDYNQVVKLLTEPHCFIYVGVVENKIIACLEMKYSSKSEIIKAAAAVVDPKFRGMNITQKLIKRGLEYVLENGHKVSLVYSTTRTVNGAAQRLTESMGFKKLGVFPNVHKTVEYETHTLAGLFLQDCLNKRYVDFKMHPALRNIYNIVAKECQLDPIETTKVWKYKNFDGDVPDLEFIDAPNFVLNKYNKIKNNNDIDLAFFPFHSPSTLITSEDGNIEVYLYINEIDKHCVITGVKIDKTVSFEKLFKKVSYMLRDKGVRYIEMIVRANRLNIIDKIIGSKFIPSGYVPAFQLEGDKRYDYVVFSRSFQILDFEDLSFEGVNRLYVDEYIKNWMRIAFGNINKNE